MVVTDSHNWTVRSALDWTAGYLERKGDESPLISAQWLLAEAIGMRRIELYTSFDRPLSLPERDVLRDYVARRGRGEPLQYITGEVGFRHIMVKVRSGVLIPRPETEVLVSEALALLPAAPRPRAADDGIDGDLSECGDAEVPVEVEPARVEEPRLLVADLCTGSGCIACSIAYEHSSVRVIATDIQQGAVDLARENAEVLGLADRVEVVECDLGDGLPDEAIGNLDLVVSNPPYVPTSVLGDLSREVADFEPMLALDGGGDGLDVFRRLLPLCMRVLKPGGAFAFELHETCLEEAARLAAETGFEKVRVVDDLAGRPRVLVARRSGPAI